MNETGGFRGFRRLGQAALAALLLLVLAQVVSAETFHAIIIGETSDPKIRASVQADIGLAEQFAEGIGQHFESRSITVLDGADATPTEVQQAIRSLDLSLDDFVFITYSGHGDRSRVGSPWPRLSLRDGELEGLDLILSLSDQGSIRHLVVFDACNGAAEMPPAREPASATYRPEQVQRLFKDSDGSIIITSSQPGNVSYTGVNGGPSRFSRAFYSVMRDALSTESAGLWRDILQRVKVKTRTAYQDTVQEPKYSLSSVLQ